MKKSSVLFILLCILMSCQSTRKSAVVFRNVNVITMTQEAVLENTSVLVSDGKIEAIGPFENLDFPETALIIDAEGQYLVPGFCDMHVHYYGGENFRATYQAENNLFIANGVTLVRNMWGYPEILKMRERIHKKKILGPEIYTTGPLIDGADPVWPGSFILDNPEDVTTAIRKMKDAGYDAIKVYDRLDPAVYAEIIRVSKELDIPVVGHVPTAVGLVSVLDSGQHSIEHFAEYKAVRPSVEVLDLTVDSGIWNCPTLIMIKKIRNVTLLRNREVPELRYVSAEIVEIWESRTLGIFHYNRVENYQTLLKTLHDRGANFVSGTDVGNPYVIPGFSLHEEFLLMQDAGLTPYQILLTTTVNPAEMLGLSDRLGTIEVGKDADLVLLEKNPLLDIANTGTIAGVMVKGQWLPSEELQSLLDEVEETYRR